MRFWKNNDVTKNVAPQNNFSNLVNVGGIIKFQGASLTANLGSVEEATQALKECQLYKKELRLQKRLPNGQPADFQTKWRLDGQIATFDEFILKLERYIMQQELTGSPRSERVDSATEDCGYCGAQREPGARFCSQCGGPF